MKKDSIKVVKETIQRYNEIHHLHLSPEKQEGVLQSIIASEMWETKLKDLVENMENIMDNLIDKGMDAEKAFVIMESVRKQKGLTEVMEASLRDCGIEEETINRYKSGMRIPPQSQVMALLIDYIRQQIEQVA